LCFKTREPLVSSVVVSKELCLFSLCHFVLGNRVV